MRTYRIYFIRHGLTDANKEGRFAGVTDIDLCTEGRQEIARLAEEFDYPNVGRVFTSPLGRCVQTAQVIYPEMELSVVPELREFHFGVYENKTAEELKDDPGFRKWIAANRASAPKGGEDFLEFGERVCAGFDRLLREMMEQRISDAAVVTHGGVMMTLLHLCGLPVRPAAEWTVDNGCGYSVLVNASLWSSSRKFEICDKLPYGKEEIGMRNLYHFIDIPEKGESEI